jgi:nicotinamidase-related amidase
MTTQKYNLGTSSDFLSSISNWLDELPNFHLSQNLADPTSAAIVSIDLVNGFCNEGPLSSPRVQAILLACLTLFRKAWNIGIRSYLLLQDNHEPDALEFSAFPPHCVRGTSEAETVPEIKALPFYSQMTVLPKNTISPEHNTGLPVWLSSHPKVETFFLMGDCTDLCVYQTAMFLRLDANARSLNRRVIVPVCCVQTYDRPVQVAKEQGGFPHDGNLMHAMALYQMALNGIEIVAAVS